MLMDAMTDDSKATISKGRSPAVVGTVEVDHGGRSPAVVSE